MTENPETGNIPEPKGKLAFLHHMVDKVRSREFIEGLSIGDGVILQIVILKLAILNSVCYTTHNLSNTSWHRGFT